MASARERLVELLRWEQRFPDSSRGYKAIVELCAEVADEAHHSSHNCSPACVIGKGHPAKAIRSALADAERGDKP